MLGSQLGQGQGLINPVAHRHRPCCMADHGASNYSNWINNMAIALCVILGYAQPVASYHFKTTKCQVFTAIEFWQQPL